MATVAQVAEWFREYAMETDKGFLEPAAISGYLDYAYRQFRRFVQRYDDEYYVGEVEITVANSTEYGLSAIVCTRSSERAERVGRAVRAGTAWVNAFLVRDLTAPFGGMGISGIGREGGDHALDFYSDLKTLQIREGSTT